MKKVEEQAEDVPLVMDCHRNREGNKYDFAFGLNGEGVINDGGTARCKSSLEGSEDFVHQRQGKDMHCSESGQ